MVQNNWQEYGEETGSQHVSLSDAIADLKVFWQLTLKFNWGFHAGI